MNKTEARSLINAIKTQAGSLEQLIIDAYNGHAWKPLGYGSWDELCQKEQLRVPGLRRTERKTTVRKLTDAGLSTRAAGSALGVNDKTIRRDLSGAANAAPGLPAATVKGRDGKTYPSKTAKKPAPSEPPKKDIMDLTRARRFRAQADAGKSYRQMETESGVNHQRISIEARAVDLPQEILDLHMAGRLSFRAVQGLLTNVALSDVDLTLLAHKVVRLGDQAAGEHGSRVGELVAAASRIYQTNLRREFLTSDMTVEDALSRHEQDHQALARHLREKSREQRDASTPRPAEWWTEPKVKENLKSLERSLKVVAQLAKTDPPPLEVMEFWLARVRSIGEVAQDVLEVFGAQDAPRPRQVHGVVVIDG